MKIDVTQFKKMLASDKEFFTFIDSIVSNKELKTQYRIGISNIHLSTKHLTRKDIANERKRLKLNYLTRINENKELLSSINKIVSQRKLLEPYSRKVINETHGMIKEIIEKKCSKSYKYFDSDLKKFENMKKKPILYVHNLTKYYKAKKIPTIDALNFDVYPGEFHAFIGANGAGKTTTIKSLIGAYYKWSGTILIDGKKNESEDAKRQICYIPEKASFPERFSAFSYLKWMIMLSGFKRSEAKKLTEKKLKEMNMWNLRKRSPNTFSSGQKKKILLAQSLICNPKIIIMDEPVANLDPKTRLEFFDALLKLVKQGKSIFASSHVLAELDIYADSLTILDGGKIIYSGKKEALLNKYNVNEYLINPGEGYKNAFVNIIKKFKFKYEYSQLKKSYVVEIKNKKDIIKLQKELSDKKIYVKLFKRNYPDLTDIYKDMIIYGSRDTMKEELENKKIINGN